MDKASKQYNLGGKLECGTAHPTLWSALVSDKFRSILFYPYADDIPLRVEVYVGDGTTGNYLFVNDYTTDPKTARFDSDADWIRFYASVQGDFLKIATGSEIASYPISQAAADLKPFTDFYFHADGLYVIEESDSRGKGFYLISKTGNLWVKVRDGLYSEGGGEEPGGENFLPQLVGIIDPDTTFKALPSLFTPLDDTITILIGAMALGFVQIVTGMAISFVEKIKKGQIMDAIWEELTWWVVFAGIACMALGVTNIVLYVGLGMVVVGSGWSAKGFGKVTAIFGSVYNHVTGYFGDILSYSRLMTLMLAGSVIASVFNTLGAIPGNVVFFLLVSVAGNGLNFALNLLSCYVHDLRLQCLEYFGKFYQDGGKPFEPLAINTKYVDIQS